MARRGRFLQLHLWGGVSCWDGAPLCPGAAGPGADPAGPESIPVPAELRGSTGTGVGWGVLGRRRQPRTKGGEEWPWGCRSPWGEPCRTRPQPARRPHPPRLPHPPHRPCPSGRTSRFSRCGGFGEDRQPARVPPRGKGAHRCQPVGAARGAREDRPCPRRGLRTSSGHPCPSRPLCLWGDWAPVPATSGAVTGAGPAGRLPRAPLLDLPVTSARSSRGTGSSWAWQAMPSGRRTGPC